MQPTYEWECGEATCGKRGVERGWHALRITSARARHHSETTGHDTLVVRLARQFTLTGPF